MNCFNFLFCVWLQKMLSDLICIALSWRCLSFIIQNDKISFWWQPCFQVSPALAQSMCNCLSYCRKFYLGTVVNRLKWFISIVEKTVCVHPHCVVKMHMAKNQKTVCWLTEGLPHLENNDHARESKSDLIFSLSPEAPTYKALPLILKNLSHPLVAGRRSDCTIWPN